MAIDRRIRGTRLKSMYQAAWRIREGMSVLIFPEGTWSAGNAAPCYPLRTKFRRPEIAE
jgi:1-acyl-sn-glycerol-3-phosphate acyltransferase